MRFETEPGHQAQVDFAQVRFPWGQTIRLIVVLGYSRLLWLRFYPKQDMRTLFAGLEEAFAFFGGVPKGAVRAWNVAAPDSELSRAGLRRARI